MALAADTGHVAIVGGGAMAGAVVGGIGRGVVVGDPTSRDTEMGPLVSAAHRDKVASYVPDDAPVAFRGSAPTGLGFWFPPTVLTPQRTDRTDDGTLF